MVRLNFSDSGQGTPVVLLHGFPLSGVIWMPQQRLLSDQYRVITPDLRGHGRSPAPAAGYEMETLAEDVLALLDDLGIPKAVIMGHSMGGYVTLAAWKMAPERFLALGLLDSQAAPDTDEGRKTRNQLADQVAKEGSAAVEAAMLPKLFAPNLDAKDPLIGQVRQIIKTTPRAGIVGALHGMAQRPDASAILAAIAVPTLILTGDGDQLIAPARATAMAAVVANAMLAVIPNAGHLPMMEQPAATTTTLLSFLSTVGNGFA